ncbi:MAG: four helix bundle protein [Vicingaceae bacterium]
MKNPVKDKSYSFAIEIVELVKQIRKSHEEYDLSRQMLRSGTSIAANIEEGDAAFSDKDFHYKFSIAYKEARETHFWLRLLRDTDYIKEETAEKLLIQLTEILKLLGSILKTMRSKK